MIVSKHLTVAVAAACGSTGRFAAIREDGCEEGHKRRRLQTCLSFLRKGITRNLTLYFETAGRRKNIYIYIFSVISLLQGAVTARTLLKATYQPLDPAPVWSWPRWRGDAISNAAGPRGKLLELKMKCHNGFCFLRNFSKHLWSIPSSSEEPPKYT